jgi:hypothetical protein
MLLHGNCRDAPTCVSSRIKALQIVSDTIEVGLRVL